MNTLHENNPLPPATFFDLRLLISPFQTFLIFLRVLKWDMFGIKFIGKKKKIVTLHFILNTL